ncbi:MAG: L,D-transpeptidase [Actinomycetota bacterium]
MKIVARRLTASLLGLFLLGAISCETPSSSSAFPPGDREADYAAVELTGVEPAGHPSEAGALVAEATGTRIRIYRHAGDSEAWTSLRNPGPFRAPRVFLVREMRDDWVRALLPMEPNGSDGWLRTGDVRLTEHPFRIEVDLGARRLTAYRGDRVILRQPAAVGTASTPTPTGRFFTTLLARPDDPSGPYGPFAFGLSAYSEVLDTFAGGDGQVAIHGTNSPWTIGQAVSHGCIRLTNRAITKLARLLPLGTRSASPADRRGCSRNWVQAK